MSRRLLCAVLALIALPLLAAPAHAAHPGANGLIAFQRGGDVFVVNPDGSGLRNVTNTPTVDERHPVLSPDGTRIAFTAAPDVYDEIYAVGVDGQGLVGVSTGIGHEVLGSAEQPTWSPDGTRIAFRGFHHGEGYAVLWVAAADGSSVEPVTTGYSVDRPDWGVGGEIAAYVAGDIYAIDPDARTERVAIAYQQAPDGPEGIDSPEWSPDGTRLAFECDTGICTATPDGAGGADWARLTGTGYTAVEPQWSPDGTEILYAGTDPAGGTGHYDLWRISAERPATPAGGRR